jgi:outer membrane lipoprotein-sorting protein
MARACMRGLGLIAFFVCVFAVSTAAADSNASADALAQFAAAWAKVNTYTCTLTAHEVLGSKTQDRVYAMYFAKPSNTRMNITGGDGHGGAAVYHGGDTVQGHQGGWLAPIRLNVNIHSHIATTIRGTTIADANWGALYDHIIRVKGSTDAAAAGGSTTLTVTVADPTTDDDVTKEVVILGKDALPVEYDQYEGTTLVKHVTYTDVKLNVDIPASTWSL